MKNPQMKLLARLVLLACASPLAAIGPAAAQEAAPAPAGAASAAPAGAGLEEVVVTARRTRERLQDVPTAVTAITAKNIEEQRITGFESVAQSVPNVYIQPQGGSPTSAQMQIRGISNGSLNKQVDSGIGLYVDGVYFGRAGASAFEIADLERVEVLRGPQGTLFGRNATAGAINLITAGPTGVFGGKAMVGFGNYQERRAKLTLNTPEFYGFSARLTVGHSESQGDQRNAAQPGQTFRFNGAYTGSVTTNERGNDSNADTGMLAVRFKGIDRLNVVYKTDMTNQSGSMNYRTAGTMTNGVPTGFEYRDTLFQPLEGEFSNKVHGQSLTAEYELTNWLTAKYIYGERRYDLLVPGNQVLGDLGTFNYPTFDTTANGTGQITTFGLFATREESHLQRSHELQLIGHTGPVDWIAGLFRFQEGGDLNDPILLDLTGTGRVIGANNTVSPPFDYIVGQYTKVDNKSKAGYLHANWSITDQWVLAGGIRRSLDNRYEDVLYGATSGIQSRYRGGNTDYDAALTYKFNPDTNVYAKWATGYVSGGSLMGTIFEPEKLRSGEIGFKTLALDRKLRLNAAVFRQKRLNGQIEYYNNGYSMGKADSRQTGLELEANYRVTRAFAVNSSYGYTESKSSGDVYVTQPRQTVYLGGEYRFQPVFGEVLPIFRMDVNWRPGYYTIKCPAGTTQDPGKDTCSGTVIPELNQAARLKSATNLNARLTFDQIHLGPNSTGRFSLWGRNLLDNRNVQYNFSLGAAVLANTFERPRTFGVDFSADF
jgi:iron complex outermembrane receptor protein